MRTTNDHTTIKPNELFTAHPKGKFKIYDLKDIVEDEKPLRWDDLPINAMYYSVSDVIETIPHPGFNFGKGSLIHKRTKSSKNSFLVNAYRMPVSIASQQQRDELCYKAKRLAPQLVALKL